MNTARQNRNLRLFIAFFILTGVTNVLNRTRIPEVDKLMTCLNDMIYVGLLLFWLQSVRTRLLPSAAKKYILLAAWLMLLYIVIRVCNYRFWEADVLFRYSIYVYWIPKFMIPVLFLATCIRIRRGEGNPAAAGTDRNRLSEAWLFLPACALLLLVITNDLHSLVYRAADIRHSALAAGTYTHGPVFYLLYSLMALVLLAGLIILFREAGQQSKRALRYLILVGGIWVGLLLLDNLVFERYSLPVQPFHEPEIHIFSMLAIFEICIRFRLIPCNENYAGFFSALRMPVRITDRAFRAVYASGTELTAEKEALKAALTEPVQLPGNRKLSGRIIRAGYAFWEEDESSIRQAQETLAEANETIEQENDLLQAENEQKEKDAYLRSRHRIYHEIAGELYPVQQRIGRLLEGAEPGTEAFRKMIADVSVLNAYVKRKTNLLLLAAEQERLSLGELFLALQESASYLTLAGLQTRVSRSGEAALPADRVTALYDAFEHIAEQLKGKAPSLMVSLSPRGLRLASETEGKPDVQGLSLPVHFRRSEGVLYMDIPAGKEAAV